MATPTLFDILKEGASGSGSPKRGKEEGAPLGGAAGDTSKESPVGSPKAPCPAKKTVKVIKIKAKVPGTQSLHPPKRRLKDNTLKASSSSDKSLSANPPVILVRGCNEVLLEAITSPPKKPVNWRVEPNENKEAPPSVLPVNKGLRAKLRTDKPGSFSVIAEADGKEIVWNVVFVWVKVDATTSVITGRKTGFRDDVSNPSTPANTNFQSGVFAKGQDAFEAQANVQVIGGGASGDLGVSKVKIHILQDGTSDTLAGIYSPPPPGARAAEIPAGPVPLLDTNGPGPGMPAGQPQVPAAADEGGTITPFVWLSNSATVTHPTGKNRTIWTGDSPGGGFPGRHTFTGAPAPPGGPPTPSRLTSISGVNSFITAIVSVSDDAPTAIVAHASVRWTANFSGSVNPATGKYTRTGAKVTHPQHYRLVSEGTGGQDARVAGLEVFGPRFNHGLSIRFTP